MKNFLFAFLFLAGTVFGFAKTNETVAEIDQVLKAPMSIEHQEALSSVEQVAQAAKDVIIIVFDDGTVIIIVTN